jgi:hypothetical protein
MKLFCGFLVIFAAVAVYKVKSGGVSFPQIDEELPPHRYISFSSECIEIAQDLRAEAHETYIKLHKIQKKFDDAVAANQNDPTEEILQEFVASYIDVEEAFIDRLVDFFDIPKSDFITTIRKFGFRTTGKLRCAYELFGEAVGDNIDFYEYCVKNLRHDLIGYPYAANSCEYNNLAAYAIENTQLAVKSAYNRVVATNNTETADYDRYLVAYHFIEIFEKAMWRLSDRLIEIYELDPAVWRQTLIYNGRNASGVYLCAYAAYYRAENTYVETYLRLLIDIMQRTKHVSYDYVLH